MRFGFLLILAVLSFNSLRSAEIQLKDGRVIGDALVSYRADGAMVSTPRLAEPLFLPWDVIASAGLGAEEQALQQAWSEKNRELRERSSVDQEQIVPIVRTESPDLDESISASLQSAELLDFKKVGDTFSLAVDFVKILPVRDLLIGCGALLLLLLCLSLPLLFLIRSRKRAQQATDESQRKKHASAPSRFASGFALYQAFVCFATPMASEPATGAGVSLSMNLVVIGMGILWTVLAVLNFYQIRAVAVGLVVFWSLLTVSDVVFAWPESMPDQLKMASQSLIGICIFLAGARAVFASRKSGDNIETSAGRVAATTA